MGARFMSEHGFYSVSTFYAAKATFSWTVIFCC